MSIPRILLVGITFIIAFGLSIIQWNISIKWWVIFWVLVFSLLISIPKELFNKKLLVALFELPYSFLLMCLNLFRLKGANKKFIHTKHGTE